MTNKVLVVDDNRPFRQVMVRFLQMEGYEVVVATGGPDGLDKCRRCRPDVVLMDVHMPQMDGFAAVRELRRFSRVPVLMLSSGDAAAEQSLGLNAGADAYLTKPFSGADLLSQVHTLLQSRLNRAGSFSHGGYLTPMA